MYWYCDAKWLIDFFYWYRSKGDRVFVLNNNINYPWRCNTGYKEVYRIRVGFFGHLDIFLNFIIEYIFKWSINYLICMLNKIFSMDKNNDVLHSCYCCTRDSFSLASFCIPLHSLVLFLPLSCSFGAYLHFHR